MKLRNKIIISFVFSLICVIFFKFESVQALTQEEAGQYIAEFSINYYNNYGDQTTYSWDYAQRAAACRGEKTSGMAGAPTPYYFENYYAVDCVGWVSMAIYQSLKIDYPGINDTGYTGYVVPTKYANNYKTDVMEDVTGQDLKPGDILANSHHVMVYVGKIDGKDRIVHSVSRFHLNYNTFEEYSAMNSSAGGDTRGVYTKVYRIKESAAQKVNKSDATTIFKGSGGVTSKWSDSSVSTSSTEAYQNLRIVDVNDKLPLFKHILLTEKYNFNNIKWLRYGHGYDGTPCDMREDLNLGLKYPKDEGNTSLDAFIDFSLPYLQTWIIPLSMNAGALTQGSSTDSDKNPLFPYTIVKEAMSDIIVNRYDLTTCVLTTKYKEYDVVRVTETYEQTRDDTGKLTGLSKIDESEETIKTGVTEPEEDVGKNVNIEPNYYLKQALTFDMKITNNTFNYKKYSDSDVDNKVEGGVGYLGKEYRTGEAINEKGATSTSTSDGKIIYTYEKKVGNYIYVDRTWKDELEVKDPTYEAYTYDDVKSYNASSSNSGNKVGVTTGSDGTIYNCKKYELSEEQKIKVAKMVYAEFSAETEGSEAMASHMANLYEYKVWRKETTKSFYDFITTTKWFAHRTRTNQVYDEIALQAVEKCLVNGQRSIPPYVVEYDGYDEMIHMYQGMERYLTIDGRHGTTKAESRAIVDAAISGQSKVLGSYGGEGTFYKALIAKDNINGNILYYSEEYKQYCESQGNLEEDSDSSSSSSTTTTVSSLNNFLFIGDSLTQGLSQSGQLSEANVIGVVGSAATHWLQWLNGQKVKWNSQIDFTNITLPDAGNVNAVSIALGINSLNIENGGSTSGVANSTLNNLKNLVAKIVEKYPDKPIYIQRVFPINSKASGYDAQKTNEVVIEYNNLVQAYCKENGYNYIDATEGYVNDDGSLLSDKTTDGVHFSDYGTWANNIKDVILNGKTTVSNNDANNAEFTAVDDDYYKILKLDDAINRVDIINSKPSNYLEYLKKGTEYSPHVGYSRAFLTFSYSTLNRLFDDYFGNTGTVPFAYGNSLGFSTYTNTNEIKSGSYNAYDISLGSGVVEGNIPTIPGAVQIPDGLGRVHDWTIWNHVNEQYNPESTWPASSSQGKLILHLTNNNERSLHGELAGEITANSKRMVCYGQWLASAMVSELGGTRGNPEKRLKVGDFVFIIQDNGTFYPVILTDTKVQFTPTKWDNNPANEYGHKNGKQMVEFQGHTSSWRDVPNTPAEFDHYIKQVYLVGNLYENPEYLNNIAKAAQDVGLNPENLINPKTM